MFDAVVITSRGEVKQKNNQIVISVAGRVVGSIPRSAMTGDMVHIKKGFTSCETIIWDGAQWVTLKHAE